MEDGLDGIRTMLVQPLDSRLDEGAIPLTNEEKAEFVGLIEEYFGQPLRNRPVRAQFKALAKRIGERLTEEEK